MLPKVNDIARKKLGCDGEACAVDFILKRDLRVIEQNFRCRFGEIDIIALDKKTVCFIEVKTRRSLDYGLGSEAVGKSKQQKIVKTALFYLAGKGWGERDFRFDVISILLADTGSSQIEYLQSAFEGF
jgi:putative endonuclease